MYVDVVKLFFLFASKIVEFEKNSDLIAEVFYGREVFSLLNVRGKE